MKRLDPVIAANAVIARLDRAIQSSRHWLWRLWITRSGRVMTKGMETPS